MRQIAGFATLDSVPVKIEQEQPEPAPPAWTAAQAIDRLQRRTKSLGEEIDLILAASIPLVSGSHDRLGEAMRYAVMAGGKRFRPALVVAVAEMVGAPCAQALRVGAAIECVHAQSLVHDDLPCMDDDDMRRGKPSLHKAFDEATAVLAGDALLALAFEILGNPATHPDSAVRIRLVTALARAVGQAGMARGQIMDLYPPDAATPDYTATCQDLKTGALIRFAVEAGAMLGECAPAEIAALSQFAVNLGRVFQIRDDLLDEVGDAQTLGKAVGKDRDAGRPTQLKVMGIDGARREARDLAQICAATLDAFGPRDSMLRDITVFAAYRCH
jgi:geranylgeranyl pyrophosphate synthase